MSWFDSFFGGGKQTETSGWDPRTTAAQQAGLDAALRGLRTPYSGYSGPGWDAYQAAARNAAMNFGQLQTMGLNPAQFTGDVAAQYMNPYNQTVIDAMRSEYDLARQAGMRDIAAGSTGRGSRSELATGRMFGDIAQQQAMSVAGLQQQGFSDAYSRWWNEQQNRQALLGNLANLGFGATDVLKGQFEEQRDWAARQAAQYSSTVTPLMQYGTQTRTMQQSSSPFAQIAGLGMTLFGPKLSQLIMGGGKGDPKMAGGWTGKLQPTFNIGAGAGAPSMGTYGQNYAPPPDTGPRGMQLGRQPQNFSWLPQQWGWNPWSGWGRPQ